MDELAWHLELPWWRLDGHPFRLRPAELLADPAQARDQYRRVLAADLRHPLDVVFRAGRWTILDGIHRLAKAVALGRRHVIVRKVPAEALPLLAR